MRSAKISRLNPHTSVCWRPLETSVISLETWGYLIHQYVTLTMPALLWSHHFLHNSSLALMWFTLYVEKNRTEQSKYPHMPCRFASLYINRMSGSCGFRISCLLREWVWKFSLINIKIKTNIYKNIIFNLLWMSVLLEIYSIILPLQHQLFSPGIQSCAKVTTPSFNSVGFFV